MRRASFTFRSSDLRKLRLFLNKTTDKYAHVRGLAVYGMCRGVSAVAIAEQLQVSQQAIYKWVRLYCRRHDTAFLLTPQRSGRPRNNTSISEQRIVEALRLDPRSPGYSSGTWTVAALAHYLNSHYHTSIGVHTLRRRMKELGLRYKRPKYVYEEKEPHLPQKKGQSSEN